MRHYKKTIIAFLLLPQYFLIKILSHYPSFIEQYYSNGIYPIISKIFRYTLGWIPFSFGDLIYVLSVIYIFRWLYKNRKRALKNTKQWIIDILAVISLFYFVFHLFWGLNYYRLPLHKSLNLNPNYSTQQLVTVTQMLIEQSNAYHLKITNNDTIKVTIPSKELNIIRDTQNGYRHLKHILPQLKYAPKSVKKSLFSMPLTYMGFSGYLNPLTNEAQINALIPLYKFPTTTAHEIAHQMGYAAENEANFIGFLATINNNNIHFKYTGYTFALHFCLNEIYRRDKTLYKDLINKVNKGILKNYEETRLFWKTHKNPIEPFFKLFYSHYLKANHQDKGLKSYSYVVALLVNYFETKTPN